MTTSVLTVHRGTRAGTAAATATATAIVTGTATDVTTVTATLTATAIATDTADAGNDSDQYDLTREAFSPRRGLSTDSLNSSGVSRKRAHRSTVSRPSKKNKKRRRRRADDSFDAVVEYVKSIKGGKLILSWSNMKVAGSLFIVTGPNESSAEEFVVPADCVEAQLVLQKKMPGSLLRFTAPKEAFAAYASHMRDGTMLFSRSSHLVICVL